MRRSFLLFSWLVFFITLATPVVPAYSQAGTSPQISVLHQYRVNEYAFALLNETITFTNNSTVPVQAPTLQLGIPNSIVSRSSGFVNMTDNNNGNQQQQQFSVASQKTNTSTIFTISPSPATLQPTSTVSFHLKTYLKNLVSHNTSSSGQPLTLLLVLMNPSLSLPVNSFRTLIQLPPSTSLKPVPTDFSSGNNNSIPFYERTQKDFKQTAASTQSFQVQIGDPNTFQPIDILNVERTLTASSNGLPRVSDRITIKNLGNVQMNRLRLALLPGDITQAAVLPSYHPPLLNPTEVTIAKGVLDFTKAPFRENIPSGNNFTFTVSYALPSQFAKVSGDKVTVNLPYSPPISGVIDNYTIDLSLPVNTTPIASNPASFKNFTPLKTGSATFEYALSLGWATQQAIPIASLLFAIVFIALFVRRGRPVLKEEEEEVDVMGGALTDMIKAFEEKIAVLAQAMEEIASKSPGTVGKKEFDEIRAKLDALRSRALQRLNETKTKSGSKKLFEITSRIAEAEREENRSAKDLVNLYEQYYTRRMRGDTFEKLLPNYRKRLDDATNRLSDHLNAAQKESRQV